MEKGHWENEEDELAYFNKSVPETLKDSFDNTKEMRKKMTEIELHELHSWDNYKVFLDSLKVQYARAYRELSQ